MRRLETRVLKFQYLKPVDFLVLLTDPTYSRQAPAPTDKPKEPIRTLLPPGIEGLSPDNLRQELTVLGDKNGLEELIALQRLLDVKRRELTITLTVGASKATAQIANNERLRLSVVAEGKLYTLEAVPHINGDSTTTFFIDIPERDDLAVINWGDATGVSRILPNGTISKTFARVNLGQPIAFKWGAATVTLTATP
jgi:hypothetical protein